MNEDTPASSDETTPGPTGGIKPLTNEQIERAVKLPSYSAKFASPMPQIDELEEPTPGWMAGLAALAAIIAVGTAILLFLKSN